MAGNLDDEIEIIYWGDEDENDTVVNSDKFNRNRRKKDEDKINWKREILSWAKLVVVAVIIAFAINNLVIINAEVPTGSMEQTIHKGSRMIGFRLSYLFSEPERGDIIIFKYPENEKETYVKRVIGCPGEYVEIRNGVVYINDEPLEEDYVYYIGGVADPAGDFPKTLVPEGSYFVLGDSRNNSKDSRYWTTTHFVTEDKILGKAIFSYYPSFNILH
ncbi:MAG: signal peptidase I [Lachnospiraceae bacterium]|nr:signal peptidase I [Lachnospiraceae bacterium]